MVVMHAHVDLGRLQMVVDVLGILRAGSPVVALGTRGLRPVVVVAAELVVGVRVLVGVGEVALRCRGQGQGVAEGRGGQGGLVVVVVVVGVGGVPGFEFGDGAVGGVLVLMFLGGGFFSKGNSPPKIRRRRRPAHACPVKVAVVGRGGGDGRRGRRVGLLCVAVVAAAVPSLGVGGVHVRGGEVVVVLAIGPLSFPARVLVDSPLVEA